MLEGEVRVGFIVHTKILRLQSLHLTGIIYTVRVSVWRLGPRGCLNLVEEFLGVATVKSS
jgi:hypothetical protein